MIPFIHVPPLHLGPITIHPFGVLVGLAVVVGTSLASRRARKLGIDTEELSGFVGCVLVMGFVGGHVIDAILYRPADVIARPLHLLAIWDGQGSFGGFLGAVLGAFAWKHLTFVTGSGGVPRLRRRAAPKPILPLVDLLVSVFPVAWIFGRMGCALAHDHPGARASADAILAVGYGAPTRRIEGPLGVELRWGDAPRYDLGLLECLLAVVIAAMVVAMWRKRRPIGWYAAVVPLVYAPVRFALDFLRVAEADGGDARYGGLTPAQWSSIALAVFSMVGLARVVTSAATRLHVTEVDKNEGVLGSGGARRAGGLRGRKEGADDLERDGRADGVPKAAEDPARAHDPGVVDGRAPAGSLE